MRKSLLLLPFGVALAQPVIEPNFADRLFPYITYGEVWSGTPRIGYFHTLPTGKFGVARPPC